jgi:hypothetical protein
MYEDMLGVQENTNFLNEISSKGVVIYIMSSHIANPINILFVVRNHLLCYTVARFVALTPSGLDTLSVLFLLVNKVTEHLVMSNSFNSQ